MRSQDLNDLDLPFLLLHISGSVFANIFLIQDCSPNTSYSPLKCISSTCKTDIGLDRLVCVIPTSVQRKKSMRGGSVCKLGIAFLSVSTIQNSLVDNVCNAEYGQQPQPKGRASGVHDSVIIYLDILVWKYSDVDSVAQVVYPQHNPFIEYNGLKILFEALT
jgi:hypothetical protein